MICAPVNCIKVPPFLLSKKRSCLRSRNQRRERRIQCFRGTTLLYRTRFVKTGPRPLRASSNAHSDNGERLTVRTYPGKPRVQPPAPGGYAADSLAAFHHPAALCTGKRPWPVPFTAFTEGFSICFPLYTKKGRLSTPVSARRLPQKQETPRAASRGKRNAFYAQPSRFCAGRENFLFYSIPKCFLILRNPQPVSRG